MCGIAGIVRIADSGLPIADLRAKSQGQSAESEELNAVVERMIAQMRHRGPDDWGISNCGSGRSEEQRAKREGRDDSQSAIRNPQSEIRNPSPQSAIRNPQSAIPRLEVCLGNTRLAIIDPSPVGHMPMHDPETGNWITYNGEIYNFRELREELGGGDGETRRRGDAAIGQGRDSEWKSQSDTEVILRAYGKWGTDCLNKLRGMFAFAIWDANLNQLLIARDGFGIKPLYYHATTDTMVFASEVRTLLASGLAPRELSREGLESYLRFGSIESPLTIIKGVRSLSPGHYLVVKHDEKGLRVREHAYATELAVQAANSKVTDYRDAVRLLRTTLEDSVRSHLVSDVPLGAFLSGGIDSSALVALMSRVAQGRPRTFTVVFEEEEFSEKSFARMVADRFGTQHCEVTLSEESLLHMLPEALAAMDQPTIDGINTYVISEAVKEAGITVALSGLGGDELFAGYPSFRRARQLRNLHVIPSPLRKAVAWAGESAFGGSVQQRKAWRLLHAGGTPQSTYTISRQLFSWEEIGALMGNCGLRIADRGFPESGVDIPVDAINTVSLCELQGYMANTLLRDTDQMSMAHSLEVRVPFVDKEVVSLVLGLKGKWKLNGARAKPLLLDAVWDLLPEEIWRRRKMGFVLPFERWMHTVLRAEMLETFSDGSSLKAVGVSESGRAIWQSFDRTPRKERWARPWALYVLKRWCELNDVINTSLQ